MSEFDDIESAADGIVLAVAIGCAFWLVVGFAAGLL
jgi:hypothetical protein